MTKLTNTSFGTPAVNGMESLMARTAKRDAIVDFASEFWVSHEIENVVNAQVFGIPAFAAFTTVALLDGIAERLELLRGLNSMPLIDHAALPIRMVYARQVREVFKSVASCDFSLVTSAGFRRAAPECDIKELSNLPTFTAANRVTDTLRRFEHGEPAELRPNGQVLALPHPKGALLAKLMAVAHDAMLVSREHLSALVAGAFERNRRAVLQLVEGHSLRSVDDWVGENHGVAFREVKQVKHLIVSIPQTFDRRTQCA